jgi:PGF-pre-PGF domain-containing protein
VNLTRAGYENVSVSGLTPASGTSIDVTLPINGAEAGVWYVVVINPDGQESTDSVTFTVTAPIPAPTVSLINPNTGLNTSSVAATITGTNFNTTISGGTTVNLTRAGYENVSVSELTPASGTSIDVTLPITGVEAGVWYVVVINPDGQESTDSVTFTITAPIPVPTVVSISPDTGTTGTAITGATITGTDFNTTAAGTVVRLTRTGETNITATDVAITGSTTITCDLDLTGTAIGDWNVVVINPDGQEGIGTNLFEVTSASSGPVVISILPERGVTGETVAITNLAGLNFQSGASVILNMTGSSETITATGVVVVSSSRITCDLDLTGAPTGTWNVVVVNPDGIQGMAEDLLTVTAVTPTSTPTPAQAPLPALVYDEDSDGDDCGISGDVKTLDGIQAGSTGIFSFDTTVTDICPFTIRKIRIEPERKLGSTTVTVARSSGSLAQIRSSPVAGYVEAAVPGADLSAMGNPVITFVIIRSWISDREIDPDDIVLMGNYIGVWEELPTSYLNRDNDLYYFRATSSGIAKYAATIRVPVTATATPTILPTGIRVTETPVISAVPPTGTEQPTPPGGSMTLPELSANGTATAETTNAPVPVEEPGGSSGIPVYCLGLLLIPALLIFGAVYLRRWWWHRQNPALFRDYD